MIRPLDLKIHYTSSAPIEIDASVSIDGSVLKNLKFYSEPSGIISLVCNVPTNTDISIGLTCNDLKIHRHPLIVSCLELDNFYQLKTYAFKGTNVYDQKFLDYSKLHNLYIEDQSDNNCLFFTGSLVYKISTPLSGMIFGRELTLISPK